MSEAQAKDLYKHMKTAYIAKQAGAQTGWRCRCLSRRRGRNLHAQGWLKGAYGVEATRKPAQYDAKGIKLDDDFLHYRKHR